MIASRTVRLRTTLRVTLITLVLGVSGCTSIAHEDRVIYDPWESTNHRVYNVNTTIDKVSLKPLTIGYRKVTPQPIRTGVSNFFRNLAAPRSAINNFLQGKPGHGFSEIGRLLINSTIGLGGLFDIATPSGLDEHNEDFGQTAAVWGIPDGPYVMLPLLGPQTLRDALLLPADIGTSPLFHYNNSSLRDKLYVLRLIDLRYRLLATDALLEKSRNPYITIRESYLQNRQFQIYDGDPPQDDDFYDELFDDE